MNAKTEAMLAEFHCDLASLRPRVLLGVIDLLTMELVEDYIKDNPLPNGADHDEIRSIMLMIRVTQTLKEVARLFAKMDAAQRPADTPPLPQDETIAKAAADAAIAKAQGKLN